MCEVKSPRFLANDDQTFVVTEAGKTAAIESLPTLSRGKRSYLAWLSVSDAYPDLTFRDFLTRPEFAEDRK